jgi:hypothetical protein
VTKVIKAFQALQEFKETAGFPAMTLILLCSALVLMAPGNGLTTSVPTGLRPEQRPGDLRVLWDKSVFKEFPESLEPLAPLEPLDPRVRLG